MSTRRDFLLRLFQTLAARGIQYVVLRNFEEVFENTDSDVDLLVAPRDVEALHTTCLDTASALGWRVVQRVRFVNHSWVFWNGGSEFVRLDVDTEIRWRCCHVLSATEVLAGRERHGEFFIPAPAQEIEILRAQIAWRGAMTERYAHRLAALGAARIEPSVIRRRVLSQTLASPAHWWLTARYLATDLWRFFVRRIAPPGVVIDVQTVGDFDAEAVRRPLAVLFPPSKCSATDSPGAVRRTLFKAGLSVVVRQLEANADFFGARGQVIAADVPRLTNPRFTVFRESSGVIHAAHHGTGGMVAVRREVEVAHFIAESLARVQARATRPARGLSVVLAGLDGSGKTTFARHLFSEAGSCERFSGARYFHWIPAARGVEFPWPTFGNLPRRSIPPRGAMGRLLSAFRLIKNVWLARWRYASRVAPLLARGELVIIDRFLLNYWLDPASVRYSGPARWLAWARRILPQPDALIVLNADAETLLSRKQELTRAQIEEQIARLRELPKLAGVRIDLDATQPPEVLVREALAHLAALPPC